MILIGDRMKVISRNLGLFILLLIVVAIPYIAVAQTNMTVIVTFDQAPTTATAIKAPLKYNKDFAFSMQIDDGDESIFSKAYPFFTGGTIGGQTYPGLVYTDGCGNDITFKMSTAQFVFNQDDENGPDIHDPESGYSSIKVTWPQMDTLYKAGWGIYNHGVNGNASSEANFMNYSLKRNKSYTRRKLFNTTEGGVLTRIHVNPNGSTPWTQACFDLGYNAALNQNSFDSFMGDNGGNVNSSAVDWSQPQSLFRLNNGEINVPNYVQGLADSSISGANYWGIVLTHSIDDQYPLTTFISDFTNIEAIYGKNGQDNILMSTDEEIIDYLIVREALNVNSVLVGNNLILTINGDVPDDLRFYALSLVINADQNISNITVTGADSVNQTAYGSNEGLINLFWDGEVIIPGEVLADSMTTIAVNTQTQRDGWVAMDYVATLENGVHKDSLRTVLCGIPGNTYDAGFCDFIIDLGPDTSICAYECDSIYAPDGFNNYTWMVADTVFDTIQNIYVCPLDTTQYILLAENDFGIATDTIIYNVLPLPIIEILPSDTSQICLGDSITFIVEGEGIDSYLWNTGDTTQSITVSPDNTDSTYKYYVDVFNGYGCSASDTSWLIVNSFPLITISDDTIYACKGDVFSVSAEAHGDYITEFIWTFNTQIDSSVLSVEYTANTSGTIYFETQTLYGCNALDSTIVIVNPSPEVNAGNDTTICAGETVILEITGDADYFYWMVDQDTISQDSLDPFLEVSPVETTIYLAIGTNEFGCSQTDNVVVNTDPRPEIIVSSDITICAGDTTTLEVTGGADFYYWMVNQDIISMDSIIKVSPDSTTVYKVIGENKFGCSQTDTVVVNILLLPETQIVYEGEDTVCQNTEIQLIATGADAYLWSTGEASDTINLIMESDTLVVLTGDSLNGCKLNDSISIKMFTVEQASFTGLLPIYCINDAAETLIGFPEGGNFLGPGMVGDQFRPSVAGDGKHIINYIFTDTNMCQSIAADSTIVYGVDTPIDLGEDLYIFPNQNIELDAGEGFESYYWSTGSQYRNIVVYYDDFPPGSTIRYVVIGVINGCTNQGEINITFVDPEGIGDVKNKKYIIYPNPNTGTFTVSYLEDVQEFQIILYDYHGRLILNQKVDCEPNCDAKIDLPKLQKGLYLLKTISEKGVSSGKIIIR